MARWAQGSWSLLHAMKWVWALFCQQWEDWSPLSLVCVWVSQLCPTLCGPMNCSHQAPLSMEFSRQEYWNGLPFPSPGDLLDPGISCIADRFFTLWATREANQTCSLKGWCLAVVWGMGWRGKTRGRGTGRETGQSPRGREWRPHWGDVGMEGAV